MKTTYNHSNGTTYNVLIEGNKVTLNCQKGIECPKQTTLDNFKTLVNIEEYLNSISIIVKGIRGMEVDVQLGSKIALSYKHGYCEGTVTKNLKGKVVVAFNRLESGVMQATISHKMIHHNI